MYIPTAQSVIVAGLALTGTVMKRLSNIQYSLVLVNILTNVYLLFNSKRGRFRQGHGLCY